MSLQFLYLSITERLLGWRQRVSHGEISLEFHLADALTDWGISLNAILNDGHVTVLRSL